MSPKLKIKKGDLVKVIAGDSKGREGRVLSVNPSDMRIVVEGINVITKHSKPTAANPNGGIVKKEAPFHISNVKLVDPKSNQATRVGRKIEGGKLVRYSKKSGEVIA